MNQCSTRCFTFPFSPLPFPPLSQLMCCLLIRRNSGRLGSESGQARTLMQVTKSASFCPVGDSTGFLAWHSPLFGQRADCAPLTSFARRWGGRRFRDRGIPSLTYDDYHDRASFLLDTPEKRCIPPEAGCLTVPPCLREVDPALGIAGSVRGKRGWRLVSAFVSPPIRPAFSEKLSPKEKARGGHCAKAVISG